MSPILQGLITIVIGVGGCVGYFYFANLFLDKVLFPARGTNIGRNINRANQIRPWLFLFPAIFALSIYLVYPVVGSFIRSLYDRGGADFVGLGNYTRLASNPDFRQAFLNNILWALVVPASTTFMGLLIAQLTDRLRWGAFAKSLIFMPMAISVVGASLIWKFVYAQDPDIGIINAAMSAPAGSFGSVVFSLALPVLILVLVLVALVVGLVMVARTKTPTEIWQVVILLLLLAFLAVVAWAAVMTILGVLGTPRPLEAIDPLQIPFWNNFLLMAILIWIQTGFSMVILSAALRGVPEETIEAAIIDGANPFQVFFKIKVPQIMGTIIVVWTTVTILVLKVFDIVYTMTGGNYGTEILPSFMMDFMFRDDGQATAVAFVIMLVVLPVMIWNIAQARKEMR